MAEGRFLLMVHTGGYEWAAAEWPPVGRVFSRQEAEGLAVQSEDCPRFLLPYEPDTQRFGRGEKLVMESGQTLWDYGEPLRLDLRAVLRAAAAAPSPDPLPPPAGGRVPVRIASVREIAVDWFGPTEPHALEFTFDVLVFDLGGIRVEAPPPVYLVPASALNPG